MVTRDNWGQIILDREGLRLLASALYWRQDREAREAAGWAEADRQALSDDPRDWVAKLSLEGTAPNAEAKARARDRLGYFVRRMCGSIAELKEVEALRIADFRFGWWMLRGNEMVIASLKESVPDYGLAFIRPDPIVELGDDLITSSLESIAIGEIRRMHDVGEEKPYPGPDEVVFALTVADICDPPPRRGPGEHEEERFEMKADREFVEDAVAWVEHTGRRVSEGIRQAIEGAEIVGHKDYWREGKLYETSRGQAARRIRRKVDAELKAKKAAALSH